MDNYSNYHTYDNNTDDIESRGDDSGLYEGLTKDEDEKWQPKDPVVLDEIKLKQEACSHIDSQKFISRNGNEDSRCPACGLWDSGDTTLK
jgi:hypothetical protein